MSATKQMFSRSSDNHNYQLPIRHKFLILKATQEQRFQMEMLLKISHVWKFQRYSTRTVYIRFTYSLHTILEIPMQHVIIDLFKI